jgi:hypothetical protein
MNQAPKKEKLQPQDQSGREDTGMQQGANLGQKDARRSRESDKELERMGQPAKKD